MLDEQFIAGILQKYSKENYPVKEMSNVIQAIEDLETSSFQFGTETHRKERDEKEISRCFEIKEEAKDRLQKAILGLIRR